MELLAHSCHFYDIIMDSAGAITRADMEIIPLTYTVQSTFQSINYNRISLIRTLFIGTKFSSIPDQLNSN